MLATKRASVVAAVILLIAVVAVLAFGANQIKVNGAHTTGAAITNIGDTPCEDSTDQNTQKTLWCCSSSATIDVTPPVISNVKSISITNSGATVQWDTNEGSTSKVNYGTTSGSLTLEASSSGWVHAHNIILSGLSADITYYYTVTSCDLGSNCKISDETSFKTLLTAPICIDADGDKYYLEGGACGLLDCNDSNVNVNIKTIFYADLDNDKFGNITNTKTECVQPPGYLASSGDCNDYNANVNPNATEVCNALDDNCVGGIDEGALPIYYKDNDNDTFGNAAVNVTLQTCGAVSPEGYVSNNMDCDDSRIQVTINTYYRDADGDGFGNLNAVKQACEQLAGYVANSNDCNDAVADINPDETEVCNGFDDNCANGIDEPFDADGDTYFNKTLCAGVVAYAGKLDFNDNSSLSYPGATEICDGVDNNGDNTIDNINGATNKTITKCACSGLTAPAVVTQRTKSEDANGIDDNCDGRLLKEEEDADSDTYAIFQGDCNDDNNNINPQANEICIDKIDNNCNGKTDDVAEGCTTNNSTNIGQSTGSNGGSRGEPSTTNATGQPQTTATATQSVLQGKKGDEITLTTELTEEPQKKKFNLFLTIPISLILAIISAVYMLYIRPKQQLNNLSEQHDMGPDASLADTQAFVNGGLAQGLPSEQLQSHLQDQGVPQARIEQAIRLTSGDMKDLGDLAKKREVGYTREYEEGEKYVSDCLDKGYSPVQVKAALSNAGWPAATVEKLIGLEVSGDLRKIAKQFGVDKKSADADAVQKFTKAAIKSGHTQESINKMLEDLGAK